jgi:hypothetical protein
VYRVSYQAANHGDGIEVGAPRISEYCNCAVAKGETMKQIFLIVQANGDKNYWKNVGVAFENKDGSLSLKIDFLPNLNLQVRDRDEHERDGDVQEPKTDKPQQQPAQTTGRAQFRRSGYNGYGPR